MIVRTEFSFREVFGPLEEVVARLPPEGGAIADSSCYGHTLFWKACAATGRHAVLGRRVALGNRWGVVLPRSSAGLRALYATPPGPLEPARAAAQDWWILAPGGAGAEFGPGLVPAYVPGVVRPASNTPGRFPVAFADNFYPLPADREAWRAMLGPAASGRPGPQHILTPAEMRLEGAHPAQLDRLREIIAGCSTPLPKAENIRFPVPDAQAELAALARAELSRRGLSTQPGYTARLEYELGLIAEKKFADYFLVIADLMRYAKQHMLIGPARGSSCGSLVCWMLRITEVDPIRHGLLFERFIDLNRFDLPDIDIDFADDKRHLVVEYLAGKYGRENVAQIGTVMRYKPKSALTDVAKHCGVPLWELEKLKDVVIERSSGDSRAKTQLADSFEQLEVGKALLAKYPVLALAGRLEYHARSAGTHAAGVIVCNTPVTDYCAVVEGGAQIDKKMAESLNMLKIDALGLRTLSIIADCCTMIGKPQQEMYELPLEDERVFALLNAHKYSSVFQFEGASLRSVARQINIDCFSDIAAITALCRPGPLSGGETTRWVNGKRTGKIEYMHPALEPYTQKTYGTIIFQEQIMKVCREMGNFSWKDTATIRKLMSNRVGNEAFGKFGDQFKAGAIANGVPEQDAQRIWKAIDTMGSWCLAGDTLLQNPFPNHVTPKHFTIEHLAQHRGYIRHKKKHSDGILKRQQLYSMDMKSGRIKPERCLDAFYNGERLTKLMLLEDGKYIRATLNHEFLKDGKDWLPLSELKVGDSIAVIGERPETLRKARTNTGSGAHNWWHKVKAGLPLYKRQVARLRARYKRCQNCCRAPYQETHHKNGVHTDHRTENLLPVCRSCHRRLHGIAVPHTIGKDFTLSRIESISLPKTVSVYDISMPEPNHNFVANGIVVHNCFNESHAVAYGMLSYWTAWLKTYHPTEFAVANLRHAKDEDSAKATLRELMREGGLEFIPVDRERSTDKWEFADGALLGPLTGLPGCGAKTAREILFRRAAGVALSERHKKLLAGESKYADYAPTRKRWGHIYDAPHEHFKTITRVDEIERLMEHEGEGRFCVIGRLVKKNLRDLNDEKYILKRGGLRVEAEHTQVLFFNIEDDTGMLLCRIGPDRFAAIGARLVEEAAIGTWLAVVGKLPGWDFKLLCVENVRWLDERKNTG